MSVLFGRARQTAKSRCGLAFDDETGEIVVAERAVGDGGGDAGGYNVWRVPGDERRAINVTADEVRTVITGWSAHTDRSRTLGDAGGGDDDDETIWRSLAEAATTLPDADAINFAWARTPDRRVTVTQAERNDVERAAARVTRWLDEQRPSHSPLVRQPRLRMETATRLVARLWFADAGGEARRRGATGTTVFVVVGRAGYGVGLCGASPTGLVYETEESFEPDAAAETAIAHAAESIGKLVSPTNLSRLGLEGPVSIVFGASSAEREEVLRHALADEFDEDAAIEPIRFSGASGSGDYGALDQATAFALGAILDAGEIPTVDLASDLEAQHRTLIAGKEEREARVARRRVTLAKIAIWAPFVLGASLLFASYVDLRRDEARTLEQTKIEEQRAAALKVESNLRLAAKQHYAEYAALTQQTLELRRRQPATAQLINDLNQQWPIGDSSWHVAEMKTLVGGAIELKGRTAREESVTAFTRGLEFSNGLFTNVSNNIQTATGDAARAGVAPLDFTVRAVYAPLSKIAAGQRSAIDEGVRR